MLFRIRALGLCLLAASCAPVATHHDASRDAADVTASHDAGADVVRTYDAGADTADVTPTVDVSLLDAAGLDTAPSDASGAPDAAGSPCSAFAEQYAAAVRAAQTCTDRSECSVLVCETLCCNCQVYVNAALVTDVLAQFQTAWQLYGCADQIGCTGRPCDPPASAECGSTGRCTTLRATGGGG